MKAPFNINSYGQCLILNPMCLFKSYVQSKLFEGNINSYVRIIFNNWHFRKIKYNIF